MVAVEARGGPDVGEALGAEELYVAEAGGAEEGAEFGCGEDTDL